MNVISVQPHFYITPITQHQQDVAGNAQAIKIGDGLIATGTALMASTPGFVSIPNPASQNPFTPNLAVCMELGDKNKICLGVLDQTSTKFPVNAGDTCMYNSTGSYIKIDIANNISFTTTQGTINLQTLAHGSPVSIDLIVDTINQLISALNTQITWNNQLLSAIATLTNSAGPVAPLPPAIYPTTNPTPPNPIQ